MNKEMGASTKDYDEKLKNHEKLKQNFEKLKVINMKKSSFF